MFRPDRIKFLVWFIFLVSVMALRILTFGASVYAKEETAKEFGQQLLSQTVADAIRLEDDGRDDFNLQMNRWDLSQKTAETEINAYKIQQSAHANLLLVPNVQLSTLENARKQNHAALDEISIKLSELNQHLQSITALQQQTSEQLVISKQQLTEIKLSQLPNTEKNALIKQLDKLIRGLSSKKELLEKNRSQISATHERLNLIKNTMLSLSDKFKGQIENRKKEDFFTRKTSPLKRVDYEHVLEEIQQMRSGIAALGKWFYRPGDDQVRPSFDRFAIVNFLIIYAIILFFLFRLRKYLSRLEGVGEFQTKSFRKILLVLIRKSLILVGTIFWLYLFISLQKTEYPNPVFLLMINTFTLILFTRWHLFCLKFLSMENLVPLSTRLLSTIKKLLHSVRYFGILYLFIKTLLGAESVLLLLVRFFMEIAILFWVIRFWKSHQTEKKLRSEQPMAKVPLIITPMVVNLIYAIIGIGLILELIGFNAFVVYWYVAWGKTSGVLLWGVIGFHALREWGQQFNGIKAEHSVDTVTYSFPFEWVLKQISWAIWFVFMALSLTFVWGGKKTIIANLLMVLTYPVTVGKMTFSILQFVYALLVLLGTHILVRFWRYILQDKILLDSPLSTGLKDSVTTITVYAFWIFGILISLQAFGVGTTSIAVGFGALGIGLGFGLQNIFNNFISGIILLFERPIQVGDDVEINGTWATVKKINVRSTVVQTYDNASLIIPNSDFISSQVTNWSFKDKRLRRNIDVGVAYGSDIEQVRKTLIEIADANRKVLKYPKPEVIFKDFGDSALIFRLRFWTTVDIIFRTETEIRFEIDRLFRERNIVIAFPQRDVHIHQAKQV